MGRFSSFVNAYACIWTFFVTIIFILPTVRPVAADMMNYAIAFLGGILGFAALFWYISGKKSYTGPLIEAQLAETAFGETKNGSDSSRRSQVDSLKVGEIIA